MLVVVNGDVNVSSKLAELAPEVVIPVKGDVNAAIILVSASAGVVVVKGDANAANNPVGAEVVIPMDEPEKVVGATDT